MWDWNMAEHQPTNPALLVYPAYPTAVTERTKPPRRNGDCDVVFGLAIWSALLLPASFIFGDIWIPSDFTKVWHDWKNGYWIFINWAHGYRTSRCWLVARLAIVAKQIQIILNHFMFWSVTIIARIFRRHIFLSKYYLSGKQLNTFSGKILRVCLSHKNQIAC